MVGARKSVVFVIGLLLLGLPFLTSAQSGLQVLINYPEVQEGDTTDSLGIYFNVTDSEGRVQTDADVTAATILLDDGVRYTAEVAQPDTPIFIVLVLDASGTMRRAAPAMRAAAIEAVESAPEEAQFVVMRFNDQIAQLTPEFTADRVKLIEAINQVESVPLAGTCLFDATIAGLEVLAQAPPGRRALILFTDGKADEKLVAGTTNQFEPCSTHTYDEMIETANRPDLRSPIHTIGLVTEAQAQSSGTLDLREIATATGGTSAIGNEEALNALFQQIMDGLRAQWLARADICPLAGARTAQLFVTIGDNVFPQPAITFFNIGADCIIATPTPEPTIPADVIMTVSPIQLDLAAETVSFEVNVTSGEERVQEFQFDFKNADTNLLMGSFRLPAPLPRPVSFPTRALTEGEIIVVISAFENQQIISRVEDTFVYVVPTPTPEPPTATPAPIGATLDSIELGEDGTSLILNVSLARPDEISELQVNVIDAETNLLEKNYPGLPVNRTVTLGNINELAAGEYLINLIAKDASGQTITQSDLEFTHAPEIAEAGTATINNFGEPEGNRLTLALELVNPEQIEALHIEFVDVNSNILELSTDALPAETIEIDISDLPFGDYIVFVTAEGSNQQQLSRTTKEFSYAEDQTLITISAVTFNEEDSIFTVQVEGENIEQVQRYRLRFVAEETSLQAAEFTFDTPTVPLRVDVTDEDLTEGKYNLVLEALGNNNRLLSTANYEGAVYTPPPGPGFFERIGDNPIILGIVAAIALGLGVLLFTMIRPRRGKTGTPILQEMTYAMKIPPAEIEKAKGKKEAAPADSEKTMVLQAAHRLPLATLTINKSEDVEQISRVLIITKSPFVIGRKGDELALADTSMSRQHAEITFKDGAFYITDLNSSNGTYLDERRLTTQTPTQLMPGQVIRLGGTTELLFRMDK